jgi:predicted O-methyltransferase YrrM
MVEIKQSNRHTKMGANLRAREMEYDRRNLKGFEGDEIMASRIKELIKQYNINLVIEGGTYIGGTTRRFAMMCDEVVTIEINLEYFERAQQTLELCRNTQMYFGSTVDLLPEILRIYKNKNILFFSDAHWQEFNPMLVELEIIYKSGLKPVIAIHDFKVPGHPELGFDTYKDIVYEWEWIRPSIEKIYGDKFTLEYNSKAEGAMRGILYILPT